MSTIQMKEQYTRPYRLGSLGRWTRNFNFDNALRVL